MTSAPLVQRLRAAGCVFAEREAAALRAAASGDRLEELVVRRVQGEPLEHLVEHVDLGRLRLSVGPGVFVPRQRTRLLVAVATRRARAARAPVLVEACAGVAPVASAVAARVPRTEVHATDVDPVALRHARVNLPPGAGVHQGSLLDGLPGGLRGRTTLLVAVPPYVPDGAAGELPREAVEAEPARALFGGPDGLDVVRALIAAAPPWLAPRGRVLLELHAAQYDAAAALGVRAGLVPRRHDAADGQTVVLDLARR